MLSQKIRYETSRTELNRKIELEDTGEKKKDGKHILRFSCLVCTVNTTNELDNWKEKNKEANRFEAITNEMSRETKKNLNGRFFAFCVQISR